MGDVQKIAEAVMRLEDAFKDNGLSGKFELTISRTDLDRLQFAASSLSPSLSTAPGILDIKIAGHPVHANSAQEVRRKIAAELKYLIDASHTAPPDFLRKQINEMVESLEKELK